MVVSSAVAGGYRSNFSIFLRENLRLVLLVTCIRVDSSVRYDLGDKSDLSLRGFGEVIGIVMSAMSCDWNLHKS